MCLSLTLQKIPQMLIIENFYTKKSIEFENSVILKEFLKMQNPTAMRYYKKIIEQTLKIEILNYGNSIEIRNKVK